MAPASEVVADIVDLAVGRAQLLCQTLRLWCGETNGIRLRPTTTVPTRFYLRILVEDHPGVLAEIATILARHKVIIASVLQPPAPDDREGSSVPLLIKAHTVHTGPF